MSRPIVIESVTLVGFGPYREKTHFEFPRGLGVFVGANETGKSTLVAAISAILFGLPSTSDPESFGLGRYRNWDAPARCLGEMVLDAAGVRYRIVRNFDTHRLTLSRWDGRGWVEEVVGEHNPGARRGNPRYVQWLASLFQHTSRELFHHTFCVVQPLPQPGRISAELQALLAGSSDRTSHLDALKRLVESAKALTRRTGARGLTPRDGQKPGKLEEIRERIDQLSEAVRRSREAMEELSSAQKESVRLSQGIEERRARLARLKKALAAFEEWRRHAENVEQASEEVRQLRRGMERLSELQTELAQAREKLALYPELAAAPPEMGEGLERLEDLFHHLEEGERLYTRALAIRREAQRLEEERLRLAMPAPAGEAAASWLRRALRDLEDAAGEWERFHALRQQLDRIKAERQARYAVFDEAAPATLEAVEAYGGRRAALQAEWERAEQELSRAKEARREADEAQRRLDERFAAAARHAADREHLKRLQELLIKTEAEGAQLEEVRARIARGRAFARILSALGLALVVLSFFFDRLGLLFAGLVASTFPTVILRLLPPFRAWRKQEEALQERVDALRAERRWIEASLSQTPPAKLEELTSLLDEIERYLEAAEITRSVHAQAAGEEELSRLEQVAAEKRAALEALEAAVRAPKEAFEDFQEAFHAYCALRASEERILTEMERMLASWGLSGIGPHEVEGFPVAGGPRELKGAWSRAAAAAHALERTGLVPSVRHLGDLVAAAGRLIREREALLERAAAFDELGRKIAELCSESERLAAPGRGVVWEHVQRAAEECLRLEAKFGGDWSAMRARVLWIESDETPSPRSLVEALPPPFAEAVAKAGGRIDEARRRWEEYRRWQERAASAGRAIEATLAALECADAAALERRIEIAKARLASELTAMEKLAQQHPSLPRPRSDNLYEGVDARYRTLEAEVQRTEAEIEEARRRLEELAYRQAQLQGEAPVNIAEAELELERLRREEVRLLEELDAVTLAYTELEAAALEYYDQHLERLAARAGEYFAAVSRTPGRRLRIGDDFTVVAVEPGGKRVLPGQLSQGARDQLYLSLRWAVGDLLAAGALVPFIFDDPFLNCDDDRRSEIREALVAISRRRQVILLTHDAALSQWGEPIVVLRGGREEGA